MDKEFSDLQMGIHIKVCTKMENHLDMDNIIGSLVVFSKEILSKD